jgi:thiamine biosynthesis protein ThiS
MKLKLNGADREFDSVRTAADLLTALDIMRERVAIMVNETVIRRANLDTTDLHDGDIVEVITMVGGG